jgi:hypothetical protein
MEIFRTSAVKAYTEAIPDIAPNYRVRVDEVAVF